MPWTEVMNTLSRPDRFFGRPPGAAFTRRFEIQCDSVDFIRIQPELSVAAVNVAGSDNFRRI
jgi:hypothetical protein